MGRRGSFGPDSVANAKRGVEFAGKQGINASGSHISAKSRNSVFSQNSHAVGYLNMKTFFGTAAIAVAFAAAPVSAANTFPIGDGPLFPNGGPALDGGGTATFEATDGFANVVVGSLSRNGVRNGTGYSDSFTFTLPNFGAGSGSVSTSFAGSLAQLQFTSVTFDNGIDPLFFLDIDADASGQEVIAAGLPVIAGSLNTLTFNYDVLGQIGSYGGNITFQAVPEPGTWALMLLGFAGIGVAMRRRRKEEVRVKYAF
ncbi:MAG: FxDxF family PEP-CTERM protein [Erythrobacter sp.]